MKLGSPFSHGAVLQRGMPVAVWGETLPGVLVRAEIAGKEGYAKSSGSGDFLLRLPPMEAGGPFELKVSVPGREEESVVLRDVLVGEVWLCSGQSNMEYRLESDCAVVPPPAGTEPLSRRQEREFLDLAAETGDFRFFTVPEKVAGCREKYCGGEWRPMDRANASKASAVAAWFGLKLRGRLHVPVGLICCSWGGTIVETWTSPEALRFNPDTRADIEAWEAERSGKEIWSVKTPSIDDQIKSIAVPDRGNRGVADGWAEPGFDDSGWAVMEIPGSWIVQRIAGNGAVWVRRKVVVPAELAGREMILRTGGIDKHDIAYFNGVEIGRTGKDLETCFWNSPREYRIPGELVRSGENTIAIRAFSFAMDGAFMPPDEAYLLTAPGISIPLAGEWRAKAEYDLGRITPPRRRGVDMPNMPGALFDSMIRPLLPFALRGVLWYQGECNANTPEEAQTYRRKMTTMIRDWRRRWGAPELAFLQVQLADYRSPKQYDRWSPWAVLRDGQRRACLDEPRVFLATALGTGDAADIHPQDKKTVGFRLAAAALHHCYGQREILPEGPAFERAVPEGGALRLFFRHAEGMTLRGEPGRAFRLAGSDGVYHPADRAEIDGGTLLLSSEKVPHPLTVRYAWADNPESILWNRDFPAAAFSSEN